MNDIQFTPVGIVQNGLNDPVSRHELKKQVSIIRIHEEYFDALFNIENCEFIDVVFYFHKSNNDILSRKIHSGEIRGVFASRSPRRPNSIGVTTVKLIRKDGNKLYVSGLDAINKSPVIDIKCCDTSILELKNGENCVHDSILKTEPRLEINNLIAQNDHEQLMLKAGQLHGHYCPGLAMGVMAAMYAMNELKVESDGMEDLLAITETNNCFSDGVQFITGCSFGNNSLIFKDLGKTAFTLTTRQGKGIRVCSKHESQELIKNRFPEFNKYYQNVVVEQDHRPENIAKFKKAALRRAFETLNLDFDKLFAVQRTKAEIPVYAKIHESVICGQCGESVMKTRTTEKDNEHICYTCGGLDIYMLDGNGILCTVAREIGK
jgi:formylmethanofuran dehydrogenase subunit E